MPQAGIRSFDPIHARMVSLVSLVHVSRLGFNGRDCEIRYRLLLVAINYKLIWPDGSTDGASRSSSVFGRRVNRYSNKVSK